MNTFALKPFSQVVADVKATYTGNVLSTLAHKIDFDFFAVLNSITDEETIENVKHVLTVIENGYVLDNPDVPTLDLNNDANFVSTMFYFCKHTEDFTPFPHITHTKHLGTPWNIILIEGTLKVIDATHKGKMYTVDLPYDDVTTEYTIGETEYYIFGNIVV